MSADAEYDLVVLGAGAAGMAVALFAAIEGLKVLLVERTAWVGGTSALAAGAMWIPGTRHALDSGDTLAKAALYLQQATRPAGLDALGESFLAQGAAAVDCLESHSDVRMRPFAYHPDYLSDLPGASTHGRVLECLPFDGRSLGPALALVRPPIPEFTVLGGMMVDRNDIGHLLNATRSWASCRYALGLVLRHARDRLRNPRGTRLLMGNALVGRLLLSLRKREVPLWTEAHPQRLLTEGGRVTGVEVLRGGMPLQVRARHGVVLAGGGFNDNPELRARLIPECVQHSPRAGTSGGELLQQALALGARLSPVAGSAAFWAPVSVRQRRDGSTAVFPHFVLDRAKPGTVVVDRHGERFLDESSSYHLFGERMIAHAAGLPDATAWLVADRRALVRYGLGMVRPGGRGLRPFLRDGYLVQAPTLEALAHKLGMPPAALRATADRMGRHAAAGVDADFQRGTMAYQRNLGDARVQPNPTLGPIAQAPFYALRLHPGDIAASTGLVTDASARVLRGATPIAGLFAAGNDMQSVMGGAYPGPGINLGPAIVFAYAAVRAVCDGVTPTQGKHASQVH